MCYFNGQKVTKAEYIRLKHLQKQVANYDFLNKGIVEGFPYGNTAVLKRKEGVEDFDIVQMEWGYIPDDWYGKPIRNRADVNLFRFGDRTSKNRHFSEPKLTLNFKGEELMLEGKKFRESGLFQKCLMISTGFFEWHHYYPLNKKTGLPRKTVEKVPHYITIPDMPYFYFPAVWKGWTDQDTGEYVETVANGTTTAEGHKMMSWVHNSKNRMPTILTEEEAWEWMFDNPSQQRITELATRQFPVERMQACAVGKEFRKSLEPHMPFVYGEDVPTYERYAIAS